MSPIATGLCRTMSFLVTTACNRNCPNCCYRIPSRVTLGPPKHYDWAYFEHAAQYLQGLDCLNVAGGEPTLHPEFRRIAREFRALFKPAHMVLCSNCEGGFIEKYDDVIECFDKVYTSREPHELSPRQGVVWMRTRHPNKLQVETEHYRSMDVYGGGGMCCRYWLGAYANGRLYPCCVGPGLPACRTIELSDNWQAELQATSRACHACAFSQPDPPGAT